MRYYTTFAWRGVRVAEGAAFEMRSAGNRRGGSNPSLSDIPLSSRPLVKRFGRVAEWQTLGT